MSDETNSLVERYNGQLQGFIVAGRKRSSALTKGGVLLVLSGIAIAVLTLVLKKACGCLCTDTWYWTFGLAALVVLAGIVCFSSSAKSDRAAERYQTEQIVLRDLEIALEVCDQIDPLDVKEKTARNGNVEEKEHVSRKTRTKELVIQTLLNRCGR